jgi:hypothetical protein
MAIQFLNTVQVDTDVLYVDTANDRVGIGTTSPGAKLDVAGDVYINSNYPSNAAANDLTIGKTTTGDHGLTIVTGASNTASIFFADNSNNDAGRIKYQHSNNSMRFETNRSEAMRITSAGNVGIGTTSPSKKLDVNGIIRGWGTGATNLANSISGAAFQTEYSGNPSIGVLSIGTLVANGGNTTHYLQAANTAGTIAKDIVLNPYGGNVGIGTTSPSQKLEVDGSIGFSKALYSDIGTNGSYITKPWGGDFLGNQGSTQTGAIKIVLPTTTGEDDMIKFTVDVYQYSTNKSFSVDVAGYVFQGPGNITWLNCTAIVNAKLSTQNWTVRFGDDGTNHCVWIGELNTVWSYPQIVVRDFMGGFLTQTTDYLLEWDVDFEATAFEDVQTTLTNNFPLSSGGVDGGFLPLSAGASYPLTGTLYGTSTNFSGSGDYAGSMILGNGASTAEAHLTIGQGRTDSGYSYIDLVGGTTYSDYGLRIIRNNTGANTTSAIIHRGTGNLEIATVESSSVLFKTGNSEKMRILANGNVGIGTTGPGSKLHINTGATYEVGSLSGSMLIEPTGVAFNGYGAGIVLGAGRGGRASGGAAIASVLDSASDVDRSGLSFFYHNSTFSDPRTEGMRLNADGKVGIGTTSPTFKLHVNSTDASDDVAYIHHNNPAQSSGDVLKVRSDAGDNAGSALLNVANNTGSALYVRGDRNVGIGTTSPGAKLEIKSGGGIRISDDAAGRTLIIKPSLTGQVHEFTSDNTAAGYSFSNNSSEFMRIAADGNVGIGTTTPDARLDVNGGLNSTHAIFSGQDGRGLKLSTENTLNNDDGVVYDAQTSTGKHLFKVSGAEKMRIDTSGNVGIGVTGPLDKLDVSNGNIRISQTGNVAAQLILNTYQSALGNATYKWFVEQTTSANSYSFQIGNGTTPYLHINSVLFGAAAGNVGIGNTSPNHKLDVTGDIYSSGQMLTKGAAMACFTVLGDLDTGLGNFNTLGRVSLVSNNKPSITVNDDKVAFDGYIATAVATTGSLNANQSQQALTSDTLAVLAVDPTGNIVRGSQEGTWTFTKAQLDALTTSTTSGTTLIAAPGANKAIIVEESNLMIKYSGTGTMSSNSFVIRQAHNGDATAEITRLPSGQINTIMSSAPANPSYGFYSRDLPLYNNDGRSFVTNKATFLSRINTNATPTNLVSISIKLKYRIFNATTF